MIRVVPEPRASWLTNDNVREWVVKLRSLTGRHLSTEILYQQLSIAYNDLRISRQSFKGVCDSLQFRVPRPGDPLLHEIANFICGEKRYELTQAKHGWEQRPDDTWGKARRAKSAFALPWNHEWTECVDHYRLRVFENARYPSIELHRNGKRIASVEYTSNRRDEFDYFDSLFNEKRQLGQLQQWFAELKERLGQN